MAKIMDTPKKGKDFNNEDSIELLTALQEYIDVIQIKKMYKVIIHRSIDVAIAMIKEG